MILVTGANGQLGLSLRKLVESAGRTDEFVFTDVAGNCLHLDITDMEAISKVVKENKIDIIINCAAYTNVEKAEEQKELAFDINARAVDNLVTAIKRVNGILIHISTDYVFGGNLNNTPCTEYQPENPTGEYGMTKLRGERTIRLKGYHHVIIRTSWLYSEYGKNFVKTMMELTASKPELKVVIDQVGTPTYAYDLAAAILCIADDYRLEEKASSDSKSTTDTIDQDKAKPWRYSKSGTYHFSNEGVCSWFDFAKMIAEFSGNNHCDIQPCRSEEFPSKVIRPSYSVLDKTKIKQTFGVAVPYWTDSLRICIDNLKKQDS